MYSISTHIERWERLFLWVRQNRPCSLPCTYSSPYRSWIHFWWSTGDFRDFHPRTCRGWVRTLRRYVSWNKKIIFEFLSHDFLPPQFSQDGIQFGEIELEVIQIHTFNKTNQIKLINQIKLNKNKAKKYKWNSSKSMKVRFKQIKKMICLILSKRIK